MVIVKLTGFSGYTDYTLYKQGDADFVFAYANGEIAYLYGFATIEDAYKEFPVLHEIQDGKRSITVQNK